MTQHAFNLDQAAPETSGHKAATLAVLRRAGIDVPDGFVIPFREYRRHHPDQEPQIAPGCAARPDAALRLAIETQLRALFGAGDAVYVAVRSSAGAEDGFTTSAAGQHDTVLAVRGRDAVAAAVHQCWSSLHSTRAEAYRHGLSGCGTGVGHEVTPVMAVLVQRFIEADTSGVMFTRTPRVIEAVPGLGDPLVSGRVTPDAWILDGTRITDRRRGTIPRRLHRVSDRLVATPLAPRTEPCLTDTDVLALDRLGRTVSGILGFDADIEWAIDGRRTHVLQARPITAPLTNPAGRAVAPALDARDDLAVVRGIPASPGRATGSARILYSPRDFHHFNAGDIIICRTTDPAWTPLMSHAGGVITEAGGLLSHAAIVARELGIPAILAIPNATQRFPDGTTLILDGERGTIKAPRTA